MSIKLVLEDYCQDCVEFEVVTNEEEFKKGFDIELMRCGKCIKRVITCEHIDRCRAMTGRIASLVNNKREGGEL